ncbi:MAG: DNA polymerase III subunit beta [Planctomycetes bacterium]|nr:DNA polymerase III subunit beta [Planctomycetota bacterium]
MKILCDRQQVQEAFAIVASIVPLKTPKPILQHVLLRAGKDSVTLFATDLEISASVTLESVKVQQPGTLLLPARETASLLRELSDATVSIENKDLRTTIESKEGSFILLGDDPEQFPREATVNSEKKVVVPAGAVLDMLRRTAFASAREETRYAVPGALLEVKDESLRMVATDGRRLAFNYRHLGGSVPAARALVPLRALQALGRAIPEGTDQPLEILFSGNQIGFRFGRTLLIGRLLEQPFPDYEAVIPKAADTSVELDRAALEANLRKVSVLCNSEVRMVRFAFSSANLALSAENSQVGRADVVMDADVKGAGGTLGFNPDYVLDAIKSSDLDTIRIDLTDDAAPAKFTLGETYTYVLMPISGS